jgi:hypothetical protein
MNWKRCGRKQSLILNYSEIFLEKLKESMKNFRLNSRSLNRDPKHSPCQYIQLRSIIAWANLLGVPNTLITIILTSTAT